jgi:hypothetical protein
MFHSVYAEEDTQILRISISLLKFRVVLYFLHFVSVVFKNEYTVTLK